MRSEMGFRWAVQPGAYCWSGGKALSPTASDGARRLCVDPELGVQAASVRTYSPLLEYTGLFQQFKDIELTEAGILGFVERFGTLLSAEVTEVPVPGKRKQKRKTVLASHEETLDFWLKEIQILGHAVRVWEQTRQPTKSRRRLRYFQWRPSEQMIEFDSTGNAPRGNPDSLPYFRFIEPVFQGAEAKEMLPVLMSDDPSPIARFWLASKINEKMQDQAAAQFVASDSPALVLQIRPSNLLQALWLQFGLAVCQDLRFSRCAYCKDWFEEPSASGRSIRPDWLGGLPELGRKNRRFCSVRCKNNFFRKRREEAVKLHQEGRDLEEIAQVLGVPVDQIQGWMKSNEEVMPEED